MVGRGSNRDFDLSFQSLCFILRVCVLLPTVMLGNQPDKTVGSRGVEGGGRRGFRVQNTPRFNPLNFLCL